MRFIFTMFAIIFTLMSFVETLSVSSDSVFLFRIMNLVALFCWGAVVKLSMSPGVDHQLYDRMIEIPAVQSETSDSSEDSSLEADI